MEKSSGETAQDALQKTSVSREKMDICILDFWKQDSTVWEQDWPHGIARMLAQSRISDCQLASDESEWVYLVSAVVGRQERLRMFLR